MFDIILRKVKDYLIHPFVKALTFFKVSPNLFSLISFAFGMSELTSINRMCGSSLLSVWLEMDVTDNVYFE